MELIVGMCRYLLPFLAFIILFKCFQTLLIGHPVNKTYGYIINSVNGEKVALNTWETSIGRSKSCDISLLYPSVSRFHAVICRRVDGWYLFDTVSKTGTFLNGKKIETGMTIKNGDDIAFGDVHFVFAVIDDPVIKVGRKKKGKNGPKSQQTDFSGGYGTSGAENGYSADYSAPMEPIDLNGDFYVDVDSVKRTAGNKTNTAADSSYSGQSRGGAKSAAAKARPAAGQRKLPSLLNQSTREKFVLCSQRITIGRGRNNDLKLNSPAVSRNHAVMTLSRGRWYITDCGSTHGTFVNGKMIKGNILLHSGDILRFGDEQLKFNEDNR